MRYSEAPSSWRAENSLTQNAQYTDDLCAIPAHCVRRRAARPNTLRATAHDLKKIEDLGFERGHRTLHITDKGNSQR